MFKLILLLLVSCVARNFAYNNELLEQLKNKLKDYQKTRIFTSKLNESISQLPHLFDPYYEDNFGNNRPLKGGETCTLCYTIVQFLIDERRAGLSTGLIALEAEAFCLIMKIQSDEICKGVIERNVDIFAYLVDNKPDLTSHRVCDIILQNDGCDSTTLDWSITIPEGTTVNSKEPSNPEQSFNIIHISDVHFDALYTTGKKIDCGKPLCCQADQEDGSVTDGTACGYWSEYSSDSSEGLVNETIRKAKEFPYDYVYLTGDIVSHRVWSTSVESNSKNLKTVLRKLKRAFGDKPIYPALGNHEPTPVNEYAIGANLSSNLSTDWLYRLVISEFSQWLPKEAKRTIMNGGYYTVSPRPGFRIIALNSNVAYTMNWWLINEDYDPYGQLTWLANTLKEAEENGEIVHILAHIPSGKSDLLAVWSREYHRIIERFANTIAAQFNGHTHHDQFMVYYNSTNTTQAISVALNGASVIPDKSNPSFRIFNVDNENYDVIDSDVWTFNLTEANLNPSVTPNWYKLYSFRDTYGVKRLTPSEFTELLPKMAAEPSLLLDYHIFRYRNSDLAVQWGCDDNCKKNYLCEISVSQVGDKTQCDWLSSIFDRHQAL